MVRCPSWPCVEEVAMMENRKDCTLRASRSCPLFSAHGAAVGGDIPIVLFHRAGEAMVAGGVSDEIVVIRLCRMHGRFERALAGIGVERNSLLQTVVVNAGDERAFFSHSRFFFYDRRHGNGAMEFL